MHTRTLAASLALTVVVTSGLVVARRSALSAAGPTCAVPGDYATIQAAVNDLGCSTINVGSGVYLENVTIARTVVLNGAQAGNAVAGRTFGSGSESTVTGVTLTGNFAVFTINGPNVRIDGFSITNSVTGGAAIGINIKVAGSGTVVTNNIIDTVTTPDPGGNGTAQAIYLETGPDNVQILGNRLNNVTSPLSAKGILIGFNGGTDPSVNTFIQGNVISNITSLAKGAYGVSVANVVPGASGLKIQNNSIDTLVSGGWIHAIGLEGDTPGVLISGNTISNFSAAGPDQIAVWFESNASFATGQVHLNNLAVGTSAFGIAVQPSLPSGSAGGTCDWWGSATGPTAASNPGGTGSKVSPKVTYAPWLIAPAPGGACIGGNVVTDKNQCKNDGWKTLVRADQTTFKNQGDCIQYANTGK